MSEGASAGSLPPHQTKTRTPHEAPSLHLAACYSSSTKRARFMALINRRCQIPGDESETADRQTATANLNRAELNSIPRRVKDDRSTSASRQVKFTHYQLHLRLLESKFACNRRILSSLLQICVFTSVLTFKNERETRNLPDNQDQDVRSQDARVRS